MGLFRTLEEKKLLATLARHGARGPWVSALEAWRAFKDFGRHIQLEGGTGLMFQVGNYCFEERPFFYFDLVVQFEFVTPDGEHESFEQLHCELTCLQTSEVENVTTDLWSFAFSDADAFYTAVEALPEFEVAVRQGNYLLRVSRECV